MITQPTPAHTPSPTALHNVIIRCIQLAIGERPTPETMRTVANLLDRMAIEIEDAATKLEQ